MTPRKYEWTPNGKPRPTPPPRVGDLVPMMTPNYEYLLRIDEVDAETGTYTGTAVLSLDRKMEAR